MSSFGPVCRFGQNLRVGFACDGICAGGNWHGTGGYYVLTNDIPLWKRAAFIYSLFVLMLAALLSAINAAWTCFSDGLEEPRVIQYQKIRRSGARIDREAYVYHVVGADIDGSSLEK
jgi:hypothetical protein